MWACFPAADRLRWILREAMRSPSSREKTGAVREWVLPSSPLKYIRAKAPAAKVEYNDGSDPAAAAALAKASQVAIVFVNQPMSEGHDARDFIVSGQSGRAGERGGCGQSAHHRRGGDRRAGGNAVDR